MDREARAEAPAGGAFLEAVRHSLRKAIDKALKRQDNLSDALKEGLREAVKEEFLSSRSVWRRSLRGALGLADKLLDRVSKGMEEYYGLVVDLHFRLVDKGLTGVGSGIVASLVEVGLSVDPLLGLPYYPGSTLKGAVRAVAEELLSEDSVGALFGHRDGIGVLVFSDSYPVGCLRGRPCLIVTGDVVTPHYFVPGRGLVEAEYEAKPTPVFHLAVAPDTVFRVVVGVDTERLDGKKAEEIVKEAVGKGLLTETEAGLDKAKAVGILAGRLVATAMASGIAARRGKGYNVFLPVRPEEVSREMIVGFRFRSKTGGGGRAR